MLLECESCGYRWGYSGEADGSVECPKCQYRLDIPAKAQVIDSDDEEDPGSKEDEKKKVKVPAKAKVVPHGKTKNTYTEEEEQFMDELEKIEEEGEIREVCLRYDEEGFNALRKKLKKKAEALREDLQRYEEIKPLLDSYWRYQEL